MTTERTAESYQANLGFDRNFSDHLFWHVRGGSSRTTFAGFDERLSLAAGVGNVWFDGDAGCRS